MKTKRAGTLMFVFLCSHIAASTHFPLNLYLIEGSFGKNKITEAEIYSDS